MVRAIAPMLVVADIERSIAFDRDVIGLAVAGSFVPSGQTTPSWASLRQGSIELMLSAPGAVTGDPGRAQLYLTVGAVGPFADRARAAGTAVTEPVIQPYGMIEIEVRDPDGFLVIIAASSDQPPP